MIIEVERNNLFSWEYAEVRARLYPTSPTEIVSVRKDGTITIPEGQYRNIPIEQAELFARLLLRAIKFNRPRWFLFENVPNLARRHKLYFRTLIEEFSSVGYRVDWRILNAANYGVPQTRERLFIAGMLDGSAWRWPTPTHFENAGWGFKRWTSWHEALKDWVKDAPPHYLPQWILKKYENRGLFDSVPENAYFPGENMRMQRQHREMWEPATTVTNGTNHVRRVVVNGKVFKLDERGAAALQTLPVNAELKNVQIGNAVPPVMAEAIFRAAFAA